MLRQAMIPVARKALPSFMPSTSRAPLRFFSSSSTVGATSTKNETVADPGYSSTPETRSQPGPAKDAAPSRDSDPFPLAGDPRLEGLSLSSKHQLEDLSRDPETSYPSRVPGREPGDESREVKIARMKYQIRHRGILETDLILSTFAKAHLESMSDADIAEFDLLLDEPDWDIFYWMTKRKEVPDRWKESFETKDRLGWRLRKHTNNEDKQTRSMPDL